MGRRSTHTPQQLRELILDALDKRLADAQQEGEPDRVVRLAHAYLTFTRERPRLWNLLFEHHLPAGTQLPAWYQQKLEGLMSHVERALAPLFREGQEADLQ